MELIKIIKIFFTAWFIIFAIIFLTRCKRSTSARFDAPTEKSITAPEANSVTPTNSIIAKPEPITPVTTTVIPKEQKPVKLIYLKYVRLFFMQSFFFSLSFNAFLFNTYAQTKKCARMFAAILMLPMVYQLIIL